MEAYSFEQRFCQKIHLKAREARCAVMSSSPQVRTQSARASPRSLFSWPPQRRWRDPVLYCAFLVVSLLIGYQLVITLLRPDWSSAVTDWFRAALSWPELAVVIFVSVWLTRARRPEALSAWMVSAAMLSYTIARNLWSVDDQFIFPNHVPFPSFPDLFFILQYPFFFLALALLPGVPPWGPRLRVILDCVLLMGSAAALSWYFILAPLYWQSREALAGKAINLMYPLGDLCVLFGLTVALIYRRCQVARAVLSLLIVAVICLVIADSWSAWLLLYPSHVYHTGNPPDLFWTAFDLLLPLAGLVQIRLMQRALTTPAERPAETLEHQAHQQEDLREVFRVLAPFGAALVACAVIAVRTIIAPQVPMRPLGPILIIFGLLLLVLVRQGITVLENAQLRRKWAVAQAEEQVLHETNQRMEAFLGVAGHELKTPLTTVLLSLQVLQRRALRQMSPSERAAGEQHTKIEVSLRDLELPLQQAGRLNRLVNDLLDTARIQSGRLELNLKPVGLVGIVRATVEEQSQTFSERHAVLHLPSTPVMVFADAERIGQVVTNFLTNAFKYSREDSPVELGVEMEGSLARAWVRDHGPGLLPADQEHIWERFYRVRGMEIQSGSGVGLGLGLYISKTIIEQHHGQVGVQSIPGQGSTFWFTLALAESAEEA